MEIFVVFKVFRQIEGEYFAVETECAFQSREAAEEYMKGKAGTWTEQRAVPLNDGHTANLDFMGMRGIHPTKLEAK